MQAQGLCLRVMCNCVHQRTRYASSVMSMHLPCKCAFSPSYDLQRRVHVNCVQVIKDSQLTPDWVAATGLQRPTIITHDAPPYPEALKPLYAQQQQQAVAPPSTHGPALLLPGVAAASTAQAPTALVQQLPAAAAATALQQATVAGQPPSTTGAPDAAAAHQGGAAAGEGCATQQAVCGTPQAAAGGAPGDTGAAEPAEPQCTGPTANMDPQVTPTPAIHTAATAINTPHAAAADPHPQPQPQLHATPHHQHPAVSAQPHGSTVSKAVAAQPAAGLCLPPPSTGAHTTGGVKGGSIPPSPRTPTAVTVSTAVLTFDLGWLPAAVEPAPLVPPDQDPDKKDKGKDKDKDKDKDKEEVKGRDVEVRGAGGFFWVVFHVAGLISSMWHGSSRKSCTALHATKVSCVAGIVGGTAHCSMAAGHLSRGRAIRPRGTIAWLCVACAVHGCANNRMVAQQVVKVWGCLWSSTC